MKNNKIIVDILMEDSEKVLAENREICKKEMLLLAAASSLAVHGKTKAICHQELKRVRSKKWLRALLSIAAALLILGFFLNREAKHSEPQVTPKIVKAKTGEPQKTSPQGKSLLKITPSPQHHGLPIIRSDKSKPSLRIRQLRPLSPQIATSSLKIRKLRSSSPQIISSIAINKTHWVKAKLPIYFIDQLKFDGFETLVTMTDNGRPFYQFIPQK